MTPVDSVGQNPTRTHYSNSGTVGVPISKKLATSEFDFDDWSEADLELWDLLRAVELYLFKDDESKYTKIC